MTIENAPGEAKKEFDAGNSVVVETRGGNSKQKLPEAPSSPEGEIL
ncbi:MAG: hypothetical protein IPN69_15910 [Acidobacteria bacterium]|nr:hypothetical protein [Acidobacteriota bacterium]MBK8150880.1 hypothetical protein [Acidobacteriota bacterium]MBK8812195.1 hypothetical protein [Acidobacteriota bacterium]